MAGVRIVQGVVKSPILASIVRDLAGAVPGIVVAEGVTPDKLVETVSALKANVAVGASNDILADDARLEALLCGGGSPVRVIALSADGRAAQLHRLRRDVTLLDDLSSAALIEAMRGTEPSNG